jgi:cytochrome c553
MRIRISRLIIAALILAAAIPVGAVILAWSGVYNVAASSGHLWLTELFLRFGMENSVKARAPDTPPPPLADANLIQLGAGHYHSGCAYCHGAPGIPPSTISLHMLPAPPELKERVGEWTDQELFWIVMHGIKYAGMPAWPAQERDDEVWALVALLRHLPDLDAAGYRALTLGGARPDMPAAREIALGERALDAASACARCHGAENRMPASALVPLLHGQPAEMLLAALQAYADGTRHSGIMQPIAVALTPEARQEMANYYAALARADIPAQPGVPSEEGRQLAMEGDAAAQIPACNGCHGADALPLYPRLAGQSGAYIAGQLRLWRRGGRNGTAGAAIMAPIAERLSESQIDALAAYYARLSRQEAAGPAPSRRAGKP